MFALYIVSAIILLADSHCHNVFVLSFVYCPVLFIFFLDCLTAQCTCQAPLSSSSTSLCFHINCGLRHSPFLLPFPFRKMPCGIRRRQTLNRPCVCVHCVYLTNTTIRKATTTVPQSGSHVVYFDLYPSPLVDPLSPHMPSLPGLPFSVAASTKTRQTFHTHQTWGPTYGVVHNFVYLIFMSCAVAITRQAKPGERER